MSGATGSATALPLLVCIVALAVAALILVTVVSGLARPGGHSTPPWSGDQGPPGAVGLTPAHGVLQADNSRH